MLLTNNDDIITSSNSNFKLSVDLSNYYVKSTDRVIFTLNGVQHDCTVKNRITITIDFDVDLPVGVYKYDMSIVNGGKVLTILDGDFIIKESFKAYLISLVHKLYRKDSWLNNVFDSAGVALGEVSAYLDGVWDDNFFDTASEIRLKKYEKEAKITLRGGQTLDRRRSQLQAKWKGVSKCTLEGMQAVADSWRNATIKLSFLNGKIHIQFISPIGIPSDLDALKVAMEEVKPAHLAIEYAFLYKTWGSAKTFGSWNAHKNKGAWNAMRQNE